jgi:anti-anti-sigma regulatory factor
MKPSKRKRKIPQAATPVETVVSKSSSVEPVRTINDGGTAALSYALGSSCTMREAAVIKAELLKLLNADQTVVLDVSAVERIDTSALQLLCAFMRDRRAQRLTTRWAGNHQAFSEAVDIVGLATALNYRREARAA